MNNKNKILTLLEQNKNSYISGETIAKQLGISRGYVWKAIKELKKDGYFIDAISNKGYCLSNLNDILSVEGISSYLRPEYSMERKIFVFDTLESTNMTAKEMAIKNPQHGTVVLANSQTSGRGRFGREFYSPKGCGLYMSFILLPKYLHFETVTAITAFAAVAVCEAIETLTGLSPKIKWVNDIYLDKSKVCGILTEATTDFESGNLEWIVLGIGINVTTPPGSFPENIHSIAGALFSSSPSPVSRNQLAGEIMNHIATAGQRSEAEIFTSYKERLMMLNTDVQVIQSNGTYKAHAIDIDKYGHLIVVKESGETLTLSTGEISLKLL